jgi:hypothetical protein
VSITITRWRDTTASAPAISSGEKGKCPVFSRYQGKSGPDADIAECLALIQLRHSTND